MEPPQPRSHSHELAWERAPLLALARLAWPITLSGLSFAIMGVVDTVFVSGLGASMLAGVGLGVVITTGLMGFGLGLMRGVKILIAQARGLGAPEAARVYVGAGILVALGLGVAMLMVGQGVALVVPRFTASVQAGEAARVYIATRSLGIPIIMVYVALREARYGFGDTRSPMVSTLIGSFVHTCLDYVALYVLGWGAFGAALANVIAFTLQCALLWRVQHADGFALGLAERAARIHVLRAGAFTGLQWALEIGSVATLSLVLAGLSDRQMAAHQMAAQLTAFSFLPALAIAESATVLAAEAVGKGRVAVVPQVARSAWTMGVGYAAVCGLVFVGFGGSIASVFTDDPELVAIARSVLFWAAIHQLGEASTLAGHGVLRGVGAQRYSALCGLSCAWLCTPLVGFVLARVYGLGAVGGWIARALEMAAATLLVWWHIERLGWVRSARNARRLARVSRVHARA